MTNQRVKIADLRPDSVRKLPMDRRKGEREKPGEGAEEAGENLEELSSLKRGGKRQDSKIERVRKPAKEGD